MPTLTWEVNATTVVMFVMGVLTFWLGVMRLGDRVKTAFRRLDTAETEIGGARLQIQSLEGVVKLSFENRDRDFADYRERIAREYCTTDLMGQFETRIVSQNRESEQRLSRQIESLGARIDKT